VDESGAVLPIVNGFPGSVVTVPGVQLLAVACSSATSCLAVGNAYPGNNGPGVVVPITNGLPDTPQTVPGTTGLSGVACSDTSTCLAVGGVPNASSNAGGALVPIVNGTIGNVQTVSGTTGLDAVACPDMSNCEAAGLVFQSGGNTIGVTVPITNGSPGSAQTVPGSSVLYAVGCASASNCEAAGLNSAQGVVVQIVNGTPGTAQTMPTYQLFGVACPSASTCLVVGWASPPSANGVVIPVTNGAPGKVQPVQPVSAGGEGVLNSIACPSTSSCIAVGNYIILPMTPPTSVLIPSNGVTLSDSLYLDAAASDNVGVTQVNYVLTGGTYNDTVISGSFPTYFGWIGGWNTTTVPNGTYTLQSVATDVEGFTTMSDPITVTVNNPPPTTTVALPASGATLTGSQWLDASASASVTSVHYEITGGTLNDAVVATATPTIFGWLAGWDTTTVPNGIYTLQSVASYTGGVTGTSAPITITVNNPPPTTAVLVPSNGATESGGAAILDASASASVTSVSFELTGGTLSDQVISSSTPTYFGWIGQWDTTTVPDGTYTLQSVASYAGGVTGTSPGITITVAN